ncbi:MAG TPA: outer membrane protein assembly factor BamD [Xanthomonadaceae bacterium]|jgi:outer membrane protein assembly factor BamD|nr:outer membrane protein assembly factor BamD [Xanthomonadaceae bacterium]
MTQHSGSTRPLLLILFMTFVFAGSGCARLGIHDMFTHKEDATETLPVDQLYALGHKQLLIGNMGNAQNDYKRLISRFPYGPYTEQAQLDLIYAQYRDGKFDDATSTVDRFIRTYPTQRHVDYAFYMKALINFNRDRELLARIARLDMSTRDQGSPRQSFNDFADLLRRFPNSRYAPDARQRMVFLREELAEHEIGVGIYYLQRKAYVAAANRGQYVIVNFPQSKYDGDALALMAESYKRLGDTKLSDDAKRVLQQNHPEHPWLAGNWPPKTGMLHQLNPFAGGQ